jgi:hypothetical protein
MRKAVHIVLGAAAAATPLGNTVAAAAPPKKIIVKKTVAGSVAQVNRWGDLQVTLVVQKTTTIVGKKKTVARKIVGASVPLYPDHTNRSVYLNKEAIPVLVQEVLQAQMNPNIQLVSGATDTSDAFVESLQAAILKAKSV